MAQEEELKKMLNVKPDKWQHTNHEKRHSYALRGINKYFILFFSHGPVILLSKTTDLDCTVFESIFDKTITWLDFLFQFYKSSFLWG